MSPSRLVFDKAFGPARLAARTGENVVTPAHFCIFHETNSAPAATSP
jgi:hypothetical protein